MPDVAAVDIVRIGHPALRAMAKPVSPELRISPAFQELVEILKATLKGSGVGLAAPQIGVALQVFIMEDPRQMVDADPLREAKERSSFPLEIVINPIWRPAGDEQKKFPEGCLSIPPFLAVVERFRTIEAEWISMDGTRKKQTLVGWPARIFQHESDHLKGRLFIDDLPDVPRLEYARLGEGVPAQLRRALGLDTA
jgi:peptide deformylase